MHSLEALRCFVATVKHGSFSAASKELNISVSSISRYVKLLEDEFKSPLLIRHTRTLALTETGLMVYEKGNSICEQINQLSEDVAVQQQQIQGNIRICAPLWYGAHYIAPLLPELTKKWPELTIYLNHGEEDLDPYGADYDLYIHMEENKDASFVARRLKSVDYCLCASPTYIGSHPVIKVSNDLNQHSLIKQVFTQPSNYWYLHEKHSDNLNTIKLASNHISSNSSLALLQVVLSHGGIALLPRKMVEVFINNQQLVELLPQYTATPFQDKSSISLIYLKNKSHNRKSKIVIDHIVKHLA
ncbi:LysR family transcriptional regulator [Photobacterium angustum]|uniref:LysR family transcriptional regulator n=1 Tax=Photobacterium angustum TaxID=661 RepID=UPI0005E8F52A|nr:LysR family transcriptional regulator [Photobacterium angustum]KJG31177.1 hypothetical protein UA69_08995 [Photobacterium angustum]PSW90249.1 LysR family transcriptional regulator [Photobacterium angustum]